jgi:hypothetical protein
MAADKDSPLPQIPLNPASSTILALNPLCASMMNSSCGDVNNCLNCVVFFN